MRTIFCLRVKTKVTGRFFLVYLNITDVFRMSFTFEGLESLEYGPYACRTEVG